MHQFKIEISPYEENGAPTNIIEDTRYADNFEQARLIVATYSAMKHENGNKKYKVTLYSLAYKIIADKDGFFAQFQA